MASLKIFISSTCYDLGIVRAQLRNFIQRMGYDPVMSDYADILFDPRFHTHESCVQEVRNADMMILIIGSRFGGKAIPKAIETLEVDKIKEFSTSSKGFEDKDKISITQLEVLKAIHLGIPIFTFIDEKVMNDHFVYEKNKDKSFLGQIDFPAFQHNKEAAEYVFEFINFIRHRFLNNSICCFNKIDDIEEFLKKQWSGLFQRILYEQRTSKYETKHIEMISEQIADIKTALITSISNEDLKDTARGAIKYRQLINFIWFFCDENTKTVLEQDIEWKDVLNTIGIVEIIDVNGNNETVLMRPSVLIKDIHNEYYEARLHSKVVKSFGIQWSEFVKMNIEARRAIINALIDNDGRVIVEMIRKLDRESTLKRLSERNDELENYEESSI